MNRVFLLLLEQQLVGCCSHSWAAPALEAPRGRNGEGGLRKNVVTLHGNEEGEAPALAHPACQDSPLSSWAACLSTSNFPAALRNQPYAEPPPTPRPEAIRAQNSQAAEPWRARSQKRERRVGRRPGPCLPWLFACGAESRMEMGPQVPSPTWVVSEKLPWLREWGSGSGKALGKPEIR